MDVAPPSVVRLALDDGGRIAADLPCVGCGYNLRGLRPENDCPECATPVARSGQGRLLRFANPRWVSALAYGMTWIWISALISLLRSIVTNYTIIQVFYSLLAPARAVSISASSSLIRQPAAILSAAIVLLKVIGFAYFTQREPASLDPDEKWNARRVLRWTMVAYVVLYLGWFPFSLMRPLWSTMIRPGMIMIYMTVFLGMTAAMIVVYAATARYAGELAERLPSARLRQQIRMLIFATCGVYALGLAQNLASMLLSRSGIGFPGFLFYAPSLCWFVIWVWWVVVAHRFRRALREAADQASMAWNHNTPEPSPSLS